MKSPRIFISYRREDSQYLVRQIAPWLRRRYGRDSVFLDVDSIDIGEDFAERIDREVRDSDVVLALVGPTWSQALVADGTNWVVEELNAAQRHGRAVFPVLHAGQLMPEMMDLPPGLTWFAKRNAFQLGDPRSLHRDLTKLMRLINAQIPLPRWWAVAIQRAVRNRQFKVATAILGIALAGTVAVAANPFADGDGKGGDASQGSSSTTAALPVSSSTATTADITTTSSPKNAVATSNVTATSTTSITSPETTSPPTTSVATTDPALGGDPPSEPAAAAPGSEIASVLGISNGHTCQLFDDRQLSCTDEVRLDEIVDVDLGEYHSCALDTAGDVWCWATSGNFGEFAIGWNETAPFRTTRMNLPLPATDVSVGSSDYLGGHTCAVLADSSVRCWGDNEHGQLGVDPAVTDIQTVAVPDLDGSVSVVAGRQSTCVVSLSGQVTCWGLSSGRFLQQTLQIPDQIVQLTVCCSSTESSFLGRDSGGALWTWTGPGTDLQQLVASDVFVDIAASRNRICGITSTAAIKCTERGAGVLTIEVPTAFWQSPIRLFASAAGTSFVVETDVGQHWDLFSGNAPIEPRLR